MVDPNQSNLMRAESVPPNVVCTNQAPFLPRAQSEQPQHFSYPPSTASASSASVAGQQTSPYRQWPQNACQNSQFYRNGNQQPGQRLLRQTLLNSRSAGLGGPYYESDPTQLHYSNNFLNAQHLSNHTINENATVNDAQSPLPTINNAQQQQQQQASLIYHNNNNAGATTPNAYSTPNNANNINNLHHHQNLLNATNRSATPITNNNANATNTVTSRVYSPTVPQPSALNNQKTPGNRANNYWDNFRR